MIDEATPARIKTDSKNSGCHFARGLLRAPFSPEELTNKSLLGKKSDSHKDSVLKEALDTCRVNAVLGMYAKALCAFKDMLNQMSDTFNWSIHTIPAKAIYLFMVH